VWKDIVFNIAFFKWNNGTPHTFVSSMSTPSTSPCKVCSICCNGYWEAKALYYMEGVENFSANFLIPTLMDFGKGFDTFFTLVHRYENLNYDSITKLQWCRSVVICMTICWNFHSCQLHVKFEIWLFQLFAHFTCMPILLLQIYA
jgi:hypothetical protein